VQLDALEVAALPLAPRRLASAAGIWRARDRSSATVCSAAEMTLDCGALQTMTPRAVAAGTSTLSRPMPARAITLRLSAAAMTSASIVVAERMTTAVVDADGGEQLVLGQARAHVDVEVRGERLDAGVGELVGDQDPHR
jgi:hypothetical protein